MARSKSPSCFAAKAARTTARMDSSNVVALAMTASYDVAASPQATLRAPSIGAQRSELVDHSCPHASTNFASAVAELPD